MRIRIICLLFIAIAGNSYAQTNGPISITTKNTELIFTVGKNKRLYQNYLGKKLDKPVLPLPKGIEAYPGGGMDFEFEPAIRVVHPDDNPSLELKYQSYKTVAIAGGTQTDILLKDEVYNMGVTLHFAAYADQDIIKTWADIHNGEKKTITLTNYASAMLHFDAGKYWLTQFHGDWAKEMSMQESQLTSGSKVIDSRLGTRSNKFQAPVFFLSLGDKPANETEGELIAGTLAWTGNFRFSFEIDNKNVLHVLSGINYYASEYRLEPGKDFTTPQFIFTYSNQGKGLASRNLHTWARKYAVLDGEKSRMTLLNNWEATGMKFNQEKLVGLFDDARKLGVDLFLLDDGWFGNKYPRDNDKSSLGDWQADKKKLPDGVPYLVKQATAKGLKFGIWIEPEMVNPKSELYEKHPDWILKLPNRDESYQRNQLVLDLTNPKVQDFVFGVVDGLFSENPDLAYIKWDCNRTMTNAYSAYLKGNQSHLYIEYTRAWYKVLDRIRAKYPHIPIMLCSGGGGRADYGALKYFTSFWPSDNTDGAERVYIQWGYSYFFPANTISAHVTNWGKQSLKFRTDVAMMDKLGYDINVGEFSGEDSQFSKEAVANYKRISNTIWFGDLYRLVSPYEANRAVLMYVDTLKTKSVLFSYNLQTRYHELLTVVRLQGLDPAKSYRIKEINLLPGKKSALACNNKVYSGQYLMEVGIDVSPARQAAFSSAVLEITAE
ncbi:alpha-galactosidase (plasmid) [Pedobacter sp. BS3]|nr:alpha-galactosidase [Pedobacter sp. BS3]